MVASSKNLQEFVNFCHQYISGKERSQAQIFLDRFFQAFRHKGALQAGAEYEVAVKKGSKQGKTGFADLVWKPRVLIEMKAKGEDLAKHYRQAFDAHRASAIAKRCRIILDEVSSRSSTLRYAV